MDIESDAAKEAVSAMERSCSRWFRVVKTGIDPCTAGAAEQLYGCSARQGV
jgi:hypothetical protein